VATYQKNKAPEAAEIKRERQAEAAREGAAAMAEYQADIIATREKTAKLRAMRLAFEAKQESKAAQAPVSTSSARNKLALTPKTSARSKSSAPAARSKKPSVARAKKSPAAKKPAARKAASR
jgi:histone H1/5